MSLCVGTTAAAHTDIVLTHIDMWLKNADPAKKPLSFFSLIKVRLKGFHVYIYISRIQVTCWLS